MVKMYNRLLLIVGILAVGVHSTAYAALDCREVEEFGENNAQMIRKELNRNYKGEEFNISNMQKVEIREVDSLEFSGCDIEIWIKLRIERQILGRAKGKILLEAEVYRLTDEQICLKDIEATEVDLSNTTRASREFYRSMANEALSNKKCFKIKMR